MKSEIHTNAFLQRMLRQAQGQKKEHNAAGSENELAMTEGSRGETKCSNTGIPITEEDVAERRKASPMIAVESRTLMCPPCPDLHSCLSTPSLTVYCSTCTNTEAVFSHDSIRSNLINSCTMPLTFSSPNLSDLMMLSSTTLTPNILISHPPELTNGSPVQLSLDEAAKSTGTSKHGCYECRWMQCGQKFYNMEDLVVHVNDYHVKVERPDIDYQCKWTGCPRLGKGFNARYKMLIHIRTHTNEKPHRCNICGKCFSRLENLKIHNRSHTGEKPYICPFEGCQKAYSNSSDRFKHVRTHQEEKPYICKMPGCNKRYTDPSSLRKHVRTHGHYYRGENEHFVSRAAKSVHPSLSSIINLGQNGVLLSPQSQHFIPIQNSIFPLPPLQTVIQPNTLLSQPIMSGAISMVTSQVTDMLPRTVAPVTSHVLKLEPAEVSSMCCGVIQNSDEKSQDAPLDLSRSPVHHPDSPDSGLNLQNTSEICGNHLEPKLSADLKNGLLLDLSNHSVGDPAKSSFSTLSCSSMVLSTPSSSRSVSLDLSCCLLPQSEPSKTYLMDIH